MKKKRRAMAWRLIRWTGTIGLGAYILSRADLPAVFRVLAGASLAWVAIAVALYVLDRAAAAYKWRLAYVAEGDPLTFPTAFVLYLKSSFLGAVLPATVGMDLIRAQLASRRSGTFAHAISSVVVERLAGVAGLGVAAAVGLVFFAPPTLLRAAAPFLGAALILLGLALAAVLVPSAFSARARRLLRGLLARVADFIADVRARLRRYGGRRMLLLVVFLIALGQQYLLTVINWVLALSLGLEVSLVTMLWVWPIVMLAVRLPISVMGFGVRELVLLESFRYAGLSTEAAVSLGLMSGALDLLFIAVGGLLVAAAPEPRVLPDDTSGPEPAERRAEAIGDRLA